MEDDYYGRRDNFRGRRGRGWRDDRGGHRGHRGHEGQRHYGNRRRDDGGRFNQRGDDLYEGRENREQGGAVGRGWHGDGGRRGHRGHEGQRHHGNRRRDEGEPREQDDRERPPPGLRGREIGMWYAKRSRGRAKAKDRENRNEVFMETHQREHIERLLDDIKSDRQGERQGEEVIRRPTQVVDNDWFESRQVIRPSFEDNKSQGSANGNYQPRGGASSLNQSVEVMDLSDSGDFGGEPMPGTSKSRLEAGSGSKSSTSQAKMEEIILEDGSVEMAEVLDSDDDMGLTEIVKEWSEEALIDVGDNREEPQIELRESTHDENLSERLRADFISKQENKEYIKMMKFRKQLPSYDMRQSVTDLIKDNQVVVLSGETGCGKTTQVPQYILDDFLERGKGSDCHIICTQPRRISAISVAQRVAAERAEKLGDSVGYTIRLENTLPRRQGSILYCTTGILLRYFETDPLIKSATHIILDEIHERDLLSDFLIIILKDLIIRRPDVKVILMSATLNAEAFSLYFNNCAMINIPGFTYPVTEHYLEDVYETLNYRLPQIMVKKQRKRYGKRTPQNKIDYEEKLEPWLDDMYRNKRFSQNTLDALHDVDIDRIDLDLIKELIRHIVRNKEDGAILVFVPGWAEIGNLNKLLIGDSFFSPSSFRIIPLHSMMPTINQREVFERPPQGVRKIVIATNIAETSITIDDIVYVIDCGKIKVKGFSPENNLKSLESQPVSLANARQRRGRAGRVQAGECYHLFSSLQRLLMIDYLPPEILRTSLEELCLQIKLLKLGKIIPFVKKAMQPPSLTALQSAIKNLQDLIIPFVKKAMQPPSLTALQSAIKNLQDLNALDKDENLLPLGKHLARMPLDPHTGKMILFGAMFGCLDPILTIAAALNFKDPFYTPLGKEKEVDRAKKELADGCYSDHILLVKTFQDWLEAEQSGDRRFCHEYFLSVSTLHMLKKMRKQLEELLVEIGFLNSRNSRAANQNADNMALVKSIVCAGLYPNVGKITKLKTKRSNIKFVLADGSKCELHPKSVTSDVRNIGTQWMVYHMKMKTTGVYIYDCSPISPYSLLFFGGDIKESIDDGRNVVTVDDWITFNATRNTVTLVKELRQELDVILEEKITKTHAVNWDKGTKQGALIQTIIDLVTQENEALDFNSFQD